MKNFSKHFLSLISFTLLICSGCSSSRDDSDNGNYIGSKSAPTEIGDIVFSDGSASVNTEMLTDEQKAAAIGVIFYTGRPYNTLGNKKLAVGLHQKNRIEWAHSGSQGSLTAIDTVCTGSGSAASSAIFSGVTSGAEGLSKLKAVCNDYNEYNYPAWYWVENYNAPKPQNASSDWYMPSLAELNMLWRKREDVRTSLAVIGNVSISMDSKFWSSSQVPDYDGRAYMFNLSYGSTSDENKTDSYSDYSVCSIIAF